MKACQIYKTNKEYKIITLYKTESWAYISSHPIYILPISTNVDELTNIIFKTLESSRSISEIEEKKMWLGDNLLKAINEVSYNKLYKNSKVCGLFLKEDKIMIVSYTYLGLNKGIVGNDNDEIEIEYKDELKVEIIQKVIDVLNN